MLIDPLHRLVLEYVDGGDLLEYVMKRRGLSASRAARLSAHVRPRSALQLTTASLFFFDAQRNRKCARLPS